VSGTNTAYAFDANGNQVSKTVTPAGGTASETDFTYTSRDRLAEVTTGGSVAAAFDYDDAGRRIRKNSATEGSAFSVWDGRSLVAETDVATGGVLRSYTHGLDLIRENVLGQVAEAYTDVLGSVGALLPEGKPAGMAAQFRYDAFGGFRTSAHPGGDCSSQPNALACNAPMTYTGHLYDPETGLFYFGARYYDPDTGRFLTHDPVAGDALNPPSLHKYLYAHSSPMDYTDPWGEYAVVGHDTKIAVDPNDPFTYNNEQIEGMRDYVKIATGSKGRFKSRLTPRLAKALKDFDSSLLQPGVYASNWDDFRLICAAYYNMFGDTRQQNQFGFVVTEDHNIEPSLVTDPKQYGKAAKGYFVDPIVDTGKATGELGAQVYLGDVTQYRAMKRFVINVHRYGLKRAMEIENYYSEQRFTKMLQGAEQGFQYAWSGNALQDWWDEFSNDPEKAGTATFNLVMLLSGGQQFVSGRLAKGSEVLDGIIELGQEVNGPITSFGDLMSPKEAARYQKHWEDLAKTVQPGTLSDRAARAWYLMQEDKIPELVDTSLPLVDQAKMAHAMRNRIRTMARALMSNREKALEFELTDPNKTFEEMVEYKQSKYGLKGKDIYRSIIESAPKSRSTLNQDLGFK